MFETTTPPKQKFFVVVGEDADCIVGYFFINSNINRYVQRQKLLFDMQMQIKRSNYPFLAYDSFIGAHELKTISKTTLSNELQSGETQIKGRLTDDDLNRLLDFARSSDIFSQYEKDTYFR